MKLILLCVLAVLAQDMPKRPPEPGPAAAFHTPARASFQLKNGLRVTVIEDHRSPTVFLRLAFGGGSAHHSVRPAGLAELMAELMTEGTASRPAKEVAEAADILGGEIRASASDDHVIVSAYGLSDKAGELIDLLAEVTGRPLYAPEELKLGKARMTEELRVERSQAGSLADLIFYRHVWGEHPYGRVVTADSVAQVNRGMIQTAHRDMAQAVNARLVVVGDAEPETVRAKLEEALQRWAPLPVLPKWRLPGPREAESGRRVFLFDRPGSEQTALRLGHRGLTEDHPDYFAFLVANQILGGTFTARLNDDLRENKGWTYHVNSYAESLRAAGAFVIRMPTRTELTRKAAERLAAHVEKMRSRKPSEDELRVAKNTLIGGFARDLETQAGLADAVLHAQAFELGEDWLDRWVERVSAVTQEDVLRAARAHMRPENLSLAAVGDAAKIEKGLSRFGTLFRVDENGEILK